MNKKEFIINWFFEKSMLSREEVEKGLEKNYFEQGLIDSFAFLELISQCEETFGMEFTDEDFSNEDIFTIKGLIDILEQK